MNFAVMLSAYAGTQHLHHDTAGAYWASDYHVVTWVVEQTLEAAEAVRNQLQWPTCWIRNVWIEVRQ